jgi:cytochrome c-type biogenesis protein CcsB
MIFNTLEQILIQFCFVIFFIVTLFSWGKMTISQTTKLSKKYSYWGKNFSYIGILFGFFSITGLCMIRWNFSDHLPLSNLYESSLFLAWSLVLIYFYLKRKIESDWLDAIITPMILITTTFTTLGLPKELQKSTVLVPALQSNWLMMHVSMMILSYGALLFGSLLAVILLTLDYAPNLKLNTLPKVFEKELYLVHPFYLQESIESTSLKKPGKMKTLSNLPEGEPLASIAFSQFLKLIYLQKNKVSLVTQIDYWSYRIIGIGFPLLTLGILSGAVWANEAWGSYWNWDPKETWALITWFIFAIYLHIRITMGWNGTKPALVASLGFFVVWMCYLGVNLLGKGLHSYGWLS